MPRGTASGLPPPFPVIVGVPRSGTTLLRMMLDSHSELAIPPETGFLLGKRTDDSTINAREFAREMTAFPSDAPAWVDFGIEAADFLEQVHALPLEAGVGDVLRLFYRIYASRHGKRRAGDKTPSYVNAMPAVAHALPEARFIHIIRDGRDVALSWRQTWFAPTKDISGLINSWSGMILGAREAVAGLRYREVFYADLVRDPAAVLQGICEFIDLRYEPEMLQYFTRSQRRLEEHKARYRADGTLLLSREDRLRQQQNTMRPVLPRDGVWRDEIDAAELTRIDRDSRALLDEIGQRRGSD
jgi:hypothetical protein